VTFLGKRKERKKNKRKQDDQTYETKNQGGELLNQMMGLVREQTSHRKTKWLLGCTHKMTGRMSEEKERRGTRGTPKSIYKGETSSE